MANLSAFYANDVLGSPLSAAQRAINAWLRIGDKPSSITIYRNAVAQTAQTVRLEFDDGTKQDTLSKAGGTTNERELVIFGVKDHPTITATNLQDDDTFSYENQNYQVKGVINLPGEVQARAVRWGN
jgi:hypothetical protein